MKLNIQLFASTNKTANYELPQFVGTDKPTWLGDFNEAMSDIDTGMHENATAISNMQSDVASATQAASRASQDVTTLTGTVNTLSGTVTSVQTTANNAQSTANSALNVANTKVSTSDLFDLVYPVGSIYLSVNSTSPSTLFGGTWTQIKDSFLLSAGDTYTAGATGGSATDDLSHGYAKIGRSSNDMTQLAYKSVSVSSGTFNRNALNNGGFGGDNRTITEGTELGGYVDTLPPYLVVYTWKRVS